MKTWDDWSDADLSFSIKVLLNDASIGNVRFDINNWSDMGPIIVDNGISIYYNKRMYWLADTYVTHENVHAIDKSPLRAAAIVFLEMNGVKP